MCFLIFQFQELSDDDHDDLVGGILAEIRYCSAFLPLHFVRDNGYSSIRLGFHVLLFRRLLPFD